MAIYVTSDIHGEYDLFVRLLDIIKLQDQDTLYVLGDVVDRGPHPHKNPVEANGNAKCGLPCRKS